MLPFQLIYIRYSKTNKHYLLLHIAERGDKVIAMDSDSIKENEVRAIRAHLNALKVMSEEQVLDWAKNHIPDAYKNALRYFDKPSVTTLHTYEIPTFS